MVISPTFCSRCIAIFVKYPYHVYPGYWELAGIDRQKTIRKDDRNAPSLITITSNTRILQNAVRISANALRCRASREICVLHFTRMHESRSCLYVGRRSKVNRDPARGRELASLIRLWRGSCCLVRMYNECTIKDCDYVASLYTTYRVRRCTNSFRASQFIFANTKVFPALLPLAQRSLDLCHSARSLTTVSLCSGFRFLQSLHN